MSDVVAPCGCLLIGDGGECAHGYELRLLPARHPGDLVLALSILTKIAGQADYLSTYGEGGAIRIDSWIDGFTPDEIALLRRLHGRVY